MLPISIHPSYEGVSIRKVILPRDAEDLIAIHINSDYGPRSSLQPTVSTMELFLPAIPEQYKKQSNHWEGRLGASGSSLSG
jgi:hypothetical protein